MKFFFCQVCGKHNACSVHTVCRNCELCVGGSCAGVVVLVGVPVGVLVAVVLVLSPLPPLCLHLLDLAERGGEGSVELVMLCGPVMLGLECESCEMVALRSPVRRKNSEGGMASRTLVNCFQNLVLVSSVCLLRGGHLLQWCGVGIQ